MNRIDRLVGLMLVLQGRRRTPVVDLARRFEVTMRTIYRDLQALAEGGFPLVSEANGYGLPDGYRLPPLTFAPSEAASLLLGARIVTALGDETLKAAALGAIARLELALPATLRSYVRQLAVSVHVQPRRGGAAKSADHEIFRFQQAIAHRTLVEIAYRDVTTGEVSERLIEPLGIVLSGERWYVVAHCRLRQELRTFRVDRIARAVFLKETFPPRPAVDPELHVGPGGDEREDPDQTVVVELLASRAAVRRLRERLEMRVVWEKPEGQNVRLGIRMAGLGHTVPLVLSFGAEVEVIGPEEVRRAIAEEVSALHTFYIDAQRSLMGEADAYAPESVGRGPEQ